MSYVENPLGGIGRHGVILITDNRGVTVRSFEGMASTPDGRLLPIGSSWLGHQIRGITNPGPGGNSGAPGELREIVFFEGTRAEIEVRMAALDQVNVAINAKGIPYVFPGALEWLFDDSGVTNSNTVIRTYFE
jgi:hypothetical protein